MTEIRPEDKILEEIGEQGRKALHYSRTRLLATWLAIGVGADDRRRAMAGDRECQHESRSD
jgi:hypothetical protein